jgi:hypothetical protein
MKINLAFICLFFAFTFAISTQIKAQTNLSSFKNALTNTFSVSRNDIWDEFGDEQLVYDRWLISGQAAPEMLPADLDTNDLWGAETNGFQLSLRVSKPEYIAGGRVQAVTVFRNLESHPQTLLVTNSQPPFVSFVFYLGTNKCLAGPKKRQVSRDFRYYGMPEASISGYVELGLGARSEKIDDLNLGDFFDSTQPGDYSVRAICRVYSPDTKVPLYEISSGTATFRLLPKPPPDAQK